MKMGSFQKVSKVIIVLLVLLFALGLSIFLGKNASNFLAKASTCQVSNVVSSQVTTNGAVVSWQTQDDTRGKVMYGTASDNLDISQIEAEGGKSHSVPLTLLTPKTTYYYLIDVAGVTCDSQGVKCEGTSCVPYTFTTREAENLPRETETGSSDKDLDPCEATAKNMGATKDDKVRWPAAEKYDLDQNGIINSLDLIKCKQGSK